jgi:aminoglycoside phosphotransferase (APT) family kinase protein
VEVVARILETPKLPEALRASLGSNPRVRDLTSRTSVYSIVGPAGEYVLRLPVDDEAIAALVTESRVLAGLRDFVSLSLPDTRVYQLGEGIPVFALHTMIAGVDWFHLSARALLGGARSRLASDLARFFVETHSVPISLAAEWLEVRLDESLSGPSGATRLGKPRWFLGERGAGIRRRLVSILSDYETALLEETAEGYDGIVVSPEDLVFGHGDIHGGNLAFLEDDIGPKLAGVFDFGNAGVIDRNYDFGRLNLIEVGLQDSVIDEYEHLAPLQRVDRDRVNVYSRAFLFYLMAEQVGEDGYVRPDREGNFRHLKVLLREHFEHRANSRALQP